MDRIPKFEKEIEPKPKAKKPKPKLKMKPKTIVKKTKKYYEERLWKGVLKIYVCLECEYSSRNEDETMLHVLKHAPEKDREQLFEKLMR